MMQLTKTQQDSNLIMDETRQQIMNNLLTLQISSDCVLRIMNAVDKLPGKDHIQGALKFLTQITQVKSKREDYYQYSNYFAEYFCTLSNLGMFTVAAYYGDFLTLTAATFSALSHAIPLQRLHDLDLLGVFLIFGKAVSNYKLIMERPDVLAWGIGALTINVMDTLITRKHLDKIGPGLHVTWHLAAALALYKFNQAQVEVSSEELQSIALATQTQIIPTCLSRAYEQLSEYMTSMSKNSHCTIL